MLVWYVIFFSYLLKHVSKYISVFVEQIDSCGLHYNSWLYFKAVVLKYFDSKVLRCQSYVNISKSESLDISALMTKLVILKLSVYLLLFRH